MSLALLRQQLAEVVAPAAPAARALPTGIAELDAVLSAGGLPRGRLTELLGRRGSGKTTLLRELVSETLSRGEWVAYVDASRTLAAKDWAGSGEREAAARSAACGERRRRRYSSGVPALPPARSPLPGLWVIRPSTSSKGAWCSDVLLRSGAFGLVILDGAPPLGRGVAARLVRLARESDAVLIVTGDGDARAAAALPAALLLRVERARRGSRRRPPPSRSNVRQVVITVERGAGRRRAVEVNHVVRVANRLSAHSEVADRRGVERAHRDSKLGTRDSGLGTRRPVGISSPQPSPDGRVPSPDARVPSPKRRRCAEPDYERPSAERRRRAVAAAAGVG
jgi:recombination protein RecA